MMAMKLVFNLLHLSVFAGALLVSLYRHVLLETENYRYCIFAMCCHYCQLLN